MTSLPAIRKSDEIESDPLSVFDGLLSALGREKLHALREQLGGQEYIIPNSDRCLHEEHFLVRAVGRDGARALIEEFQGIRIHIPMTPKPDKDERYLELMRAGLSNVEIGRELGVTVRHVRRRLAVYGCRNPNFARGSRRLPAEKTRAAERPAQTASSLVSPHHTRESEMAR